MFRGGSRPPGRVRARPDERTQVRTQKPACHGGLPRRSRRRSREPKAKPGAGGEAGRPEIGGRSVGPATCCRRQGGRRAGNLPAGRQACRRPGVALRSPEGEAGAKQGRSRVAGAFACCRRTGGLRGPVAIRAGGMPATPRASGPLRLTGPRPFRAGGPTECCHGWSAGRRSRTTRNPWNGVPRTPSPAGAAEMNTMKNSAHNNMPLTKTDNRWLTQRLAEKRALRNPCDSVRIRAVSCEPGRCCALSCPARRVSSGAVRLAWPGSGFGALRRAGPGPSAPTRPARRLQGEHTQ